MKNYKHNNKASTISDIGDINNIIDKNENLSILSKIEKIKNFAKSQNLLKSKMSDLLKVQNLDFAKTDFLKQIFFF